MIWQATIQSYIRACTCFCSIARTYACMQATDINSNIHEQFSSSVPRKSLHAFYHRHTASDSNSSVACPVVAVVSVIQEQLLRRPWTQTSFLPGACHWQTQAWRVSFLRARRGRPFTPRNHGSSTCDTPAPARITNLATETTERCIHFKMTG